MVNETERISSNLFCWDKEYLWPLRSGQRIQTSKNEIQTISKFKCFSNGLSDVNKIEHTVNEILKWGGTYARARKGAREKKASLFANKLISIIDGERYDFLNLTCDDVVSITKGQNLSSWTKVLAAFKPGVFFIYDSRVAMALNKCTDTNDWHSPSGKKATKQDAELYYDYLRQLKVWATTYIADYRNKRFKNIREAYENAGFSETQAIMAHLEKMLFMMKEKIVSKRTK